MFVIALYENGMYRFVSKSVGNSEYTTDINQAARYSTRDDALANVLNSEFVLDIDDAKADAAVKRAIQSAREHLEEAK